MAWVKNHVRWILLAVLPLGLLIWFLGIPPERAQGGTYTDPFWTSSSPEPECVCEGGACGGGCGGGDAPSEWLTFSPEGVSVRTGEAVFDFFLFDTPGYVERNVFSLRWRSMASGVTQMGRGMIPSWEHSVRKVILNSQNPNGSGGHKAEWRRPDGLIVDFSWNGSSYSTSNCSVTDTLSTSGGNPTGRREVAQEGRPMRLGMQVQGPRYQAEGVRGLLLRRGAERQGRKAGGYDVRRRSGMPQPLKGLHLCSSRMLEDLGTSNDGPTIRS